MTTKTIEIQVQNDHLARLAQIRNRTVCVIVSGATQASVVA